MHESSNGMQARPVATSTAAAAASAILLQSCGGGQNGTSAPTTPTTPPTQNATTTTVRDVAYATTNSGTLMLDIVRPASPPAGMPVVIFVHGGGFTTGTKSDGLASIEPLAQRGYFGVSIDYRLAPAAIFPAQIEDVKAAIRF